MAAEKIQSCESCGASVYPEHIESGKAETIDNKLLCPHCVADYKKSHHADEQRYQGQSSMRAPGESDDLSPIRFDADDTEGQGRQAPKQISSIGGDTMAGADATYDDSHFKRPVDPNSRGATRCRTFHAKLNDGAVSFMNAHVAEWTDANPNVVIKFATSTIGVFEGKKADPHLILTVFY